MSNIDVIVVGLGCVGISTVYYCANQGLKVLGIDMYSKPGSIGSSSFGETRLWRTTHGSTIKNKMMWDSLKLWNQIEQDLGKELLVQTPVLNLGSPEHNKDFKDMMDQFPNAKYLTPKEIMETYPALKNIPDHYMGLVSYKSGIVKARQALESVRTLAEKNPNVTLMFNTKVIEATKNSVTIMKSDSSEESKGEIVTETFYADSVVVAAGAYTAEQFDKQGTAKRLDVEYYVFSDISGMPPGIVEFTDEGNEFYGMLDGPNFDQYKLGDWKHRSLKTMLDHLKIRMPEKIDSIKYAHPCYFTMVDTGEFQYKTGDDGVHYAYGFSGTGFKFLPLHGKIVYEGLVTKTNQEYVPLKFRAKL